jgi:hypothetical protein
MTKTLRPAATLVMLALMVAGCSNRSPKNGDTSDPDPRDG